MPEGLIAPALRRVVRDQANTKVVLSEVREFDLAGRRVSVVAPNGASMELPYDILAAAGATHGYFGHDEWAAYAPGMKTLEDARHLRNHILGAFELAELTTDPAERDKDLTFVVIGAGRTGAEVVGPRLPSWLTVSCRGIITRSTLVRPGSCSSKLRRPCSARSTRSCSATPKLGSNGWASKSVAAQRRIAMDDDSITVRDSDGEERIPARRKVWAAGVKASPLAGLLARATGAETAGGANRGGTRLHAARPSGGVRDR